DAAADVGDAPGRGRDDRLAELAVDVDALAARLGEPGDDLALDRPDELRRGFGRLLGGLGSLLRRIGLRELGRLGRRRGSLLRRFEGLRLDAAGAARR